jgi:adenylate cyclase
MLPPVKGPGRALSICVLPFQNMSGDAEQEYFSDGISEDITTDLSRVSALGVVARNTAFTFKAHSVNVLEVAKKLGVSHVLEGSVRKAGGRVRISAQLIDGATGEHVWADRFDRDLEDIFTIQDEISKSIVRALKLKLLPQEKKAIEQRETSSVEAYNLYLLARQYWDTGNQGDMRREERVMRICSRAVELDSQYARAWALLSLAHSNLRYVFRCQVDDGFAAAHTALTIDPTIADAHCPMIRRLEDRQDYAEADARIKQALRLDPDSWAVNKEAARICMRQGRLEDAAELLEKAVAVMESDVHGWARLVSLFRALGDEAAMRVAAEAAVKQAEQALARDPSDGSAMSYGALARAALGQSDRARELMERALLIDSGNLGLRYNLACIYAGYLGEPEAALNLLDLSFASASAFHISLADCEPDLASLRGDPRFEAMLASAKARLGIATAPVAPDPA